MGRPVPAAVAVQHAADAIAARRRGNLAGAEALLAAFPTEQTKTLGFYLLANLALNLLQAKSGQTMDELVQQLSPHLATTADQLCVNTGPNRDLA